LKGFVRQQDGSFVLLQAPAGTAPYGINASGQVVGGYLDASSRRHGFLLSPQGEFTVIDIPGATETTVYAINDSGTMVGRYWGGSRSHGVLWNSPANFLVPKVPDEPFQLISINSEGTYLGLFQEGGAIAMDSYYSTFPIPYLLPYFQPTGMNDFGEIAGSILYELPGFGIRYAGENIYRTAFGMQVPFPSNNPLDPGANVVLTGIGNAGQIIGYAGDRGLLLTPCTAVSQPASSAFSFPAAGGEISIPMSAPAGCRWFVPSALGWVTPSSGAGDGSLKITAGPNNSIQERSGTLHVGGQTISLRQNAAVCTYSLSANQVSFDMGGGTGTLTVSTASYCPWLLRDSDNWIFPFNEYPVSLGIIGGTGPATLDFRVLPNYTGFPRSTTIQLEQDPSLSISIHQGGATTCLFDLPVKQISAAGGNAELTVALRASIPGCEWTATSNAAWITVTKKDPAAYATTLTLAVNNTSANRTGTVSIAGFTLTITQLPQDGLRFVPIRPCRLMDTRSDSGFSDPFGAPSLKGGMTRDVPVRSGACGIPAGARAYSLNVTVVPQGPLDYLTVWPASQPRPQVSTLNSLDGRITASAAIVTANSAGVISIYAPDPADVILDINGYFLPASEPAGLTFYPLPPCRALDTRSTGQVLQGGVPSEFILAGKCGLPSPAQVYSLNLTVETAGKLGFLAAWGGGESWPGNSTLNATSGVVTANAAIVKADASGAIRLLASEDTHVVVDVNGYFGTPSGSGGYDYHTVPPCRVADTRRDSGFSGRFGPPALAAGVREFPIAASSCLPAGSGAVAYALNATVLPPASLGYLALYPTGTDQPLVSTLNAPDGQVTANMAIVTAGIDGSVTALATDATTLVLDISGYFGK
jgi:hypothetical protein